MSDHVYKQIEITGSSTKSIDHAVTTAISRAGQSVEHLRWFEVTQIRGDISDGVVSHWQVTVKIGFTLNS
jgi:dodecin